MRPRRKFVVAGTLIVLAIAWVILQTGGYLMPQAPNNHAFPRDVYFADHEQGLVAVTVRLENNSQREIRLVDATLDAPGIEVVRVEAVDELPAPAPPVDQGSSGDVVAAPATDGSLGPTIPLPIMLTDEHVSWRETYSKVVIWFRPTECTDTGDPWGFVEVTVDFGDGAFPPVSRTYRSERPLWSGGQTDIWAGDGFVVGDGPLSLACEVLQ